MIVSTSTKCAILKQTSVGHELKGFENSFAMRNLFGFTWSAGNKSLVYKHSIVWKFKLNFKCNHLRAFE